MSYVGKITDTSGNTGLVGSTLYGTCSTGASTAAKVVTCADFDQLLTGVTIHVKFTNSNTASTPTLNVNSTGAKNIYKYGTTKPGTTAATSWYAGSVVSFTYDGSYWQMNDHIDDTTISNTDEKVKQVYISSGTPSETNYRVLLSNSDNNTTETASVYKSSGLIFNPLDTALTIGTRGTGTVGATSFAQGTSVKATNIDSFAQGSQTTASGYQSHAEGYITTASGSESHSEGDHTIANHKSQHAFGEYNIEDPSTAAATARGNYVEIVGNGTSSARSNARTLDWSGNEWLAGGLTIGTPDTVEERSFKYTQDQAQLTITGGVQDEEVLVPSILLKTNTSLISTTAQTKITSEDIIATPTWDGTNASLRGAISSLNSRKLQSYVGMVIFSTTLDTMTKVVAQYGGTTWIQHSGYMLRGATSGVTANTASKTGGADTVNLEHSHTVNNHTHYQTTKFTKSYITSNGFKYTQGDSVVDNNQVSTGGASPGTDSKLSTSQSVLNSYKSVYIWERTV